MNPTAADDRPAGTRPGSTPALAELAESLATFASFGHSGGCSVWRDAGDECDCPLAKHIEGALVESRIVAVIEELGFDPATGRGDHLLRTVIRPSSLAEMAIDPGILANAAASVSQTCLDAMDRKGWCVIHERTYPEPDVYCAGFWESIATAYTRIAGEPR